MCVRDSWHRTRSLFSSVTYELSWPFAAFLTATLEVNVVPSSLQKASTDFQNNYAILAFSLLLKFKITYLWTVRYFLQCTFRHAEMITLHFALVQCGASCVFHQLVARTADFVVQVWYPDFYGASCVKLRMTQANFKTCRCSYTDKSPWDKKGWDRTVCHTETCDISTDCGSELGLR